MALSICLKWKWLSGSKRHILANKSLADSLSISLTSFSYRVFHYAFIDSAIIKELQRLCWSQKIYMLFSHTSQPRSKFCYYIRFVRFKIIFRIPIFFIEGWGNRNIEDYTCAKTNVHACSYKVIIDNKCLVCTYIHSLDFSLNL